MFLFLFCFFCMIFLFLTYVIDRGQYKDRLAGFFLYVSNSTTKDDGFLCFHDLSTKQSTISWDQKISCSVNGRYVIYYNERKIGVTYPLFYSKYAFIELCEVEVYGDFLYKFNKYIYIQVHS